MAALIEIAESSLTLSCPSNSSRNREEPKLNPAEADRPMTVSGPISQQCETSKKKQKSKPKPKQRGDRSQSRSQKNGSNNATDTNANASTKRPKTTACETLQNRSAANRIIPSVVLADIPRRTGVGSEDAAHEKQWILFSSKSEKCETNYDLPSRSEMGNGEFTDIEITQATQLFGSNFCDGTKLKYTDKEKKIKLERVPVHQHQPLRGTSGAAEIDANNNDTASDNETAGDTEPQPKSGKTPHFNLKKDETKNGVPNSPSEPSDQDADNNNMTDHSSNSYFEHLVHSVTSLITTPIRMRQDTFQDGRGSSVQPSSNFFTFAATHIGNQLFRVGRSVANAFRSERDLFRDDTITYNGYKIHTFGKHLCINSIILRGSKGQKLRIVVQTSDYEGFTLPRSRSRHATSGSDGQSKETKTSHGNNEDKDKKSGPYITTKYHFQQSIFSSEEKWTLIYGCYEEEGSGLVEIEPPRRHGVSLKGITTEGPCKGLIFIDVPYT